MPAAQAQTPRPQPPAQALRPQPRSHRPRASSLRPGRPKAIPAAGPLTISMHRYSDSANVFSEDLADQPLWQVQISHDSRPSILGQLLASLDAFLASRSADDPDVPSSVRDLKERFGTLVQLTGANPVNHYGADPKPWSVALCVTGDASSAANAVDLLLDFADWRCAANTAKNLEIMEAEIHLPEGFEWTAADRSFKVNLHHGLRGHPFDVLPPFGAKPMVCALTVDDTGMHVTGFLCGSTWAHRARLDEAGAIGGRGDTKEFVRNLPTLTPAMRRPSLTLRLFSPPQCSTQPPS